MLKKKKSGIPFWPKVSCPANFYQNLTRKVALALRHNDTVLKMSEHGAWITRSYVHLWRKPELGKLSKYEKTVQPLVKVLLLSELKCLYCLLSKMVCVFGWKWEHSTCSLDSFMSHPLYHPLFKKLTRPAPFCSLSIAKTQPQIERRVTVSVCMCGCVWVSVCVLWGRKPTKLHNWESFPS